MVIVNIDQQWHFKKDRLHSVLFRWWKKIPWKMIPLLSLLTTLGSNKLYIVVKSLWDGRGEMGLPYLVFNIAELIKKIILFFNGTDCYWITQQWVYSFFPKLPPWKNGWSYWNREVAMCCLEDGSFTNSFSTHMKVVSKSHSRQAAVDFMKYWSLF